MAQLSHEKLGIKYLPVPNVQDLAAKFIDGMEEVPERYIRPDLEEDVPVISHENVELPVIDLGRLLDPNLFPEESAKLGYACREFGFFQLINHGVHEESIEKMKTDVAEFFKLSLEQRMEIAQLPDGLGGYGQYFVMSDEQKLEWADMIYLITQPVDQRDMRLWPTQPPTFRDILSNYSMELNEVAKKLLEAMAKNLGIPSEALLDNFKNKQQSVRINYYPPCPKANKVIGLKSHTDGTALTLLLQVNDVQGLQIKKDGQWVAVKPLPGAFIANIGDSLEIITNGKYKSIEHRAMINSEKERLSIAAFHSTNRDETLGPLPELLKESKAKYKTVSFQEFMTAYFASKLDRSLLESMKLKD